MVFTFFPQSGRYTAPPHAIPTESCRMADTSQNDIESYKQKAALRALDMVEDGMRIGIGTGSTADYFTRALGNAVREGLRVIGVATSRDQTQGGVKLIGPVDRHIKPVNGIKLNKGNTAFAGQRIGTL
jgi:N-acetylmuramic acid 6-phosphate (MurNAc-6-P) etherase